MMVANACVNVYAYVYAYVYVSVSCSMCHVPRVTCYEECAICNDN